MSRDKEQEPLSGIEEVQGPLERWRQGRRAGQAMPDQLWSGAARLAARHGAYRVARQLGLEYSKLKKRLEQLHPKQPQSRRAEIEAIGFVELDPSRLLGAPAVSSEAVVELFGVDGARMRISLPGHRAVDLPSLVGAFWRRCERCCR